MVYKSQNNNGKQPDYLKKYFCIRYNYALGRGQEEKSGTMVYKSQNKREKPGTRSLEALKI